MKESKHKYLREADMNINEEGKANDIEMTEEIEENGESIYWLACLS